jgi:dolichol-phosphate mannosyltransferase
MVSTHGRRFTCYTVVGITGVVVNTVLLYLLVSRLGLNHLVAAAISTEVSVLTNFALNDAWTFRDTRAGSWWIVRAAQYNAVALGGMVISLAVLATLTMGLGLHYLVANLFAMAASTLSNYALNTRFTWAGSIQSGPAPQRLSVVADV